MASRTDNTRFETTPDGACLRIGFWPTKSADAAGQVALLPGRTEFLEKYEETIGELGDRGFDVWSMDWRGQGLSERLLANRHKGHIRRFETYLDDLQWFMANFVASRPARRTIVLAHSMGGHIALRAILEGRIAPERAVLSAPMIDLPIAGIRRRLTELLTAGAMSLGAGARYAFGMHDYDPAHRGFEGNPLTGDEARFNRLHDLIASNPDLALGGVTWAWLHAAFKSIATLDALSNAPAATCPTLICTGLQDRVVSRDAQRIMCERLPDCLHAPFADARHEILIETDAVRARFWGLFDDFVGDSAA